MHILSKRSLSTAALVGALVATAASLQAAPTVQPVNGSTSVELSADFINALGALGLTPGTVGRGSLRGTTARFPISGGAIDIGTLKVEIAHDGGLSLSTDGVVVRLFNFNIDTTGSTPVLTGLVVVNGDFLGRLPLFDLELTEGPTQRLRFLFLRNVNVTLSAVAADALNSIFGVTAFVEGFDIGVARVVALVL